ncbi:MAG TPA: SDR family oxidoreductase [Candidatus Saccharimonadales bacterium]|nr:SDR family oxidoreductase [Candidatus Saccharimonadales bacterium]
MSDTGRLQDRIVVITGSTGIAAAAARRASDEGASVFVVSRTSDHARDLATSLSGPAAWAQADLTEQAEVEAAIGAAVSRFGRIDGCFSVAGGSGRRFGDGPIHAMTAAGWDGTLNLNLRSQALVAAAVTHQMRAQTAGPAGARGSIVLVSSVLAASPVPELFATHAYAAAKGAIVSLARTMAATYAGDGIRVNVVAPGLTETPMSQRAAEDPATVEFVHRKQPLVHGFLTADDIAHAAIYLLANESRAVTGQVLTVDGGWSVTAAAAAGAAT